MFSTFFHIPSPGSVEFLAQEMPEDIPNEDCNQNGGTRQFQDTLGYQDPRGDGSPLLNRREKEHYKGLGKGVGFPHSSSRVLNG